MTTLQLRASLRLWQGRERQRKALHARAQRELDEARAADVHPRDELVARRDKRTEQLAEARAMIAKRSAQLAGAGKPRLITARELGLTFQYVWGSKGPIYRGAGHYTAGGRCADAEDLKREIRSAHAYHKSKGWGGLSYEAMIADDGTIAFGNPPDRKSAAVASNNTGMIGVCVPGTTGDRMTPACKASVKWLLANWHTSAVPATHRLPRPVAGLDLRGHREFPGQSTACPGVMLIDYKELLK